MDSVFRRSEVQFMHQSMTRQALVAISQSDDVVIYCGAGVSIDRTGFGWGQLLSSVFAPEASSHPDYPTAREVDLLRQIEDPVRLASILLQYSSAAFPTATDLKRHIVPLLQNRLYKSNSWQAGRLMATICQLAIYSRVVGKTVHIVTTNYDTYLEQAYNREVDRTRREMQMAARSIVRNDSLDAAFARIPQLSIWVRDAPDHATWASPTERRLPNGQDGKTDVNLHYLHGRVPPEGESHGHIVLSEHDYAATRLATIDTLKSLLREESTVLILGASLTDPPLVDALALTRRVKRPGEATQASSRYVMMPRASFGQYDSKLDEKTSNRIVKHLAMRCEHLGAQLLVPDFRYQTAQFLQELTYCGVQYSAVDYLDDKQRMRYGLRLEDWWRQWTSQNGSSPKAIFWKLVNLSKTVFQLIDRLSPHKYGERRAEESFRMELWVREDPRNHRRLALWADTSGPTMDQSAMKRAELLLDSDNASVRTFGEGRPQHIDFSDLGQVRPISQWKSYLCIPIYVSINDMRTPVGVVTLASTADKSESVLPMLKLEDMLAIKGQMIGLARRLLRLNDPAL
jgi:hypothetical protein